MNLQWNDEQRALLEAVGQIVAHHRAQPLAGDVRFEASAALERDLADGGYFECASTDGLGPVAAAALVMELARVPACAEIAASALLLPALSAPVALRAGSPITTPSATRPALPLILPRSCAVLGADRAAPARFLAQAGSVVAIGDDGVFCATLRPGDARPVDSLFAYPMGVLAAPEALAWQCVERDPAELRDIWRVALAAEITGNLGAALDSVGAHVTDRRQFGRPLGSFQGIQHRLAQCATTIEGLRALTLAAAAGEVPAALAAGQAQQAVRPVCYDLHQFMGAMGLTLEHPLHRWTYRARRLQSELGGAEQQFVAAAGAAWPGASTGDRT